MPTFEIGLDDGRALRIDADSHDAALEGAQHFIQHAPAAGNVKVGTTGEIPDIGYAKAFGIGAAQGATANFADELYGLAKAGGGGLSTIAKAGLSPGAALADIAFGALRHFTGKDNGQYEEGRNQVRDLTRTAEEQYPGTTLAGNIVGGSIAPVGRAAQAGTIGGRMLAGAGTGALYGGLAGVGAGEDTASRVVGGLGGAVVGGGVGAAAAPIIEGAIQGTRFVARPVISAIQGIRDPDGVAANQIINSIRRGAEIDPGAATRLTPQEVAQSIQSGGPATIMDLGGESTRALARSAANVSPEGRAVLNQSINDRFETQSPRIAEWLNDRLNYPTAQARENAINNVRQNVYEPRYARAYRDSANIPLWDRDLEQIAQAPEVQTAIRIATPQLRNWAVRDGLRPPVGAFEIANGRTTLRETQAGNTIMPSLQYWDYVKRALDGMGTPTSQQFARVIRDHLDQLVPAYRAARESAQPTRFFNGASNGFEAGQNFVNQGQHFGDAARQQIARMTPEERGLFQDGYTSALVERIERSPDRRNVLNTIAATPAARREIETAIGTQRWRELEAQMRVEGIMDLGRGAVTGNSTTARQLVELGLAGGTGVASYYNSSSPSAMVNAALVYGAARGRRVIDARVAQRVAQMLTSNDPQVLQRGVQMVARNNALLNQLRRVDAGLARVGAQSGTQFTPMIEQNISRMARPEEDQPNVPRPLGQ